ncbi:MAG TPA: hypothetical protein VG348_15970 [Acidimicrobiia bacterium]|nr:hypothetical protein [Acidimicrobiia bacterium]
MEATRRIAACVAMAAGVVVSAGPATASPAPEVAPKGSCKLVTVGEAGSILGSPVGAGKQQTRSAQGVTGDRCVWAAKKKGTGGLKGQPLELEIVVESGATLVSDYNTAKSANPTKTDAVPALGDDAFIKDLKLHVLVGDRVLSTALHNYRYPKPLTQAQIQQKAEDAAKLALGRLG